MIQSSISIVVPCFNEEGSISVFLDRIIPVLSNLDMDYEIIFIDDGSFDDTYSQILSKKTDKNKLRIIRLSRNFGKEAALTAGLDRARGDVVVPIDVDLQDPPEVIEKFVEEWRKGADIVVGVRSSRKTDSLPKRVTAQFFYRIFNMLSENKIPPNAGDFRLLDRAVVEVIRKFPERLRFMKGLLHWAGFRTTYVYFEREPRVVGHGKWMTWKLFNFGLDGIFSFSTLPLRITTFFGVFIAVSSLAYMIYLLLRTLIYGVDVPGYASLGVMLLFSIAANMIAIGILGEYVGRIYNEVKGRPLYIVAEDSGEIKISQSKKRYEIGYPPNI